MNATPRILLVEDEPSIADAVCFVLKQEGFLVEWCPTLAVARAQVKNSWSLVILDVGLPDGSGFEFCKELRRMSTVPVVFLTARAEELDRVVGLEIGGDDYVSKPFSPRELAARVKAILRRVQPHSQEMPGKQTSAVMVDREKCCIMVAGKDPGFTKSEFLLVESLMMRPGQVHSRRQLLEALSGCPDATTERAIDAHIKSLRRKLDEALAGASENVVTHRGFGYSWKSEA